MDRLLQPSFRSDSATAYEFSACVRIREYGRITGCPAIRTEKMSELSIIGRTRKGNFRLRKGNFKMSLHTAAFEFGAQSCRDVIDHKLEWQLSLHPKCGIGVAICQRLSSPCRFFRLRNVDRAAGAGSRLPASSLPCRSCKAGHLGLVRGRRWRPNCRWHGRS